MYRCGVCGKCSRPGESRKTAAVERKVPPGVQYHRRETGNGRTVSVPAPTPARTEIAREVPLCGDCHRMLEAGKTVRELELMYRSVVSLAPAVTLPIRLGSPARVVPSSSTVSRPDPTGGPAS